MMCILAESNAYQLTGPSVQFYLTGSCLVDLQSVNGSGS